MSMLLIQIGCALLVGGCLYGMQKTEMQYLKIVLVFGAAFFAMFFVGTIM